MISGYLALCLAFGLGWVSHCLWIWAKDKKGGDNDNAPIVDTFTFDDMKKGINVGYKAGILSEKWKRPQGEWIEDDNHNIVCPFCSGIRRDCRIDHINFCNRCGARMDGGKS